VGRGKTEKESRNCNHEAAAQAYLEEPENTAPRLKGGPNEILRSVRGGARGGSPQAGLGWGVGGKGIVGMGGCYEKKETITRVRITLCDGRCLALRGGGGERLQSEKERGDAGDGAPTERIPFL